MFLNRVTNKELAKTAVVSLGKSSIVCLNGAHHCSKKHQISRTLTRSRHRDKPEMESVDAPRNFQLSLKQVTDSIHMEKLYGYTPTTSSRLEVEEPIGQAWDKSVWDDLLWNSALSRTYLKRSQTWPNRVYNKVQASHIEELIRPEEQ